MPPSRAPTTTAAAPTSRIGAARRVTSEGGPCAGKEGRALKPIRHRAGTPTPRSRAHLYSDSPPNDTANDGLKQQGDRDDEGGYALRCTREGRSHHCRSITRSGNATGTSAPGVLR
jgi:hypothetical protein